VRYDAAPQRDEEHPEATTTEETAADSTERTPLLQQPQHHVRSKEESGAIGWWILQLILAVSVPVTLLAHIIVLLVGAMAQSIADGGGVVTCKSVRLGEDITLSVSLPSLCGYLCPRFHDGATCSAIHIQAPLDNCQYFHPCIHRLDRL
jgi:hypothetical protein